MTLRNLGDQFTSFLNTQQAELESLGSKNILDWPISYLMLVGVFWLIIIIFVLGLMFYVLGDLRPS
jgi:Tfp pilus assembly protein PilO